MSKDLKVAVGVAAGVVGVAALGGALAYLMYKENEFERHTRHVSSRPMNITVQIPVDQGNFNIVFYCKFCFKIKSMFYSWFDHWKGWRQHQGNPKEN